jgi:hypothetical protein
VIETDGWARQLHSIDASRLVLVCSEEDMRYGLCCESSTLDWTRPLPTDGRYHHLVLGEIIRSIPSSVSDKRTWFFPAVRAQWYGDYRFIHSHHDRKTSTYWPPIRAEDRMTVPCLAKVHSRYAVLKHYAICFPDTVLQILGVGAIRHIHWKRTGISGGQDLL